MALDQRPLRAVAVAALEKARQILAEDAHILIDEDTDREPAAIEQRFMRELAQ